MEKHCACLHGEKESIHKKKWKIQEKMGEMVDKVLKTENGENS